MIYDLNLVQKAGKHSIFEYSEVKIGVKMVKIALVLCEARFEK